MSVRVNRPLTKAAVAFAATIPILVIAGVFVNTLVGKSLADLDAIDRAIESSNLALRSQLDMETGVRGYLATGNAKLLEPYLGARIRLPEQFAQLHTRLRAIDDTDALSAAADAQRFAGVWENSVAEPIVHSIGSHARLVHEEDFGQYHGKLLVDRIRSDFDAIDATLASRRGRIIDAARNSVDQIWIFVAIAILAVLGAGFFFLREQRALFARLERAREAAAEERRRNAEIQISFETEKRIADTLQEALMQRPLPSLPTVRFSATYVPAQEDAKVGGDWYDAIELTSTRVLFSIGDVAGHGLDAAVGMSRARQAFIGSALRHRDPSVILRHVNEELIAENAPMVTAVCGVADSERYEFVFATAGHPPPVLIEPGREPRLLECGGLPLGIVSKADYRTFTIQTVPGAMLVLYTDGAVEHSHDVIDGERLLLEAARSCTDGGGAEPAARIHETIFGDRPAGDDVAILTIGFSSEVSPGMNISAEHPRSSFTTRLRGRANDGWSTSAALPQRFQGLRGVA